MTITRLLTWTHTKHGGDIRKTKIFPPLRSEKWGRDVNVSNITTMLSVGPGIGHMDAVLIDQCPKLMEYVAIEPSDDFLSRLTNTLASYNTFKKTFIKCKFEEYEGPAEYFDAIFFIHITKAFDDKTLEDQMKRALRMLKKGGKIVVVDGCSDMFYENCERISGKKFTGFGSLCDILRKLDDHLIDQSIDLPFDFSDPGPLNHALIDIAFERKATDEEKANIMEELSKHFIPGTKLIEAQDTVFVLSNH